MPETKYPPLPELDTSKCLTYDLIRYVTGYPENYVHQYAMDYAAPLLSRIEELEAQLSAAEGARPEQTAVLPPQVVEPDTRCPDCGQVDIGQRGEYHCKTCGLPRTWDSDPLAQPEPTDAQVIERIECLLGNGMPNWPDLPASEVVRAMRTALATPALQVAEPHLRQVLERTLNAYITSNYTTDINTSDPVIVAARAALATPPAASPQGMTEALERDAKRYRWLCNNNFDKQGAMQVHTWVHTWEPHSLTGEPTEWVQRIRGGALDRIIDAALSSHEPGERGGV